MSYNYPYGYPVGGVDPQQQQQPQQQGYYQQPPPPQQPQPQGLQHPQPTYPYPYSYGATVQPTHTPITPTTDPYGQVPTVATQHVVDPYLHQQQQHHQQYQQQQQQQQTPNIYLNHGYHQPQVYPPAASVSPVGGISPRHSGDYTQSQSMSNVSPGTRSRSPSPGRYQSSSTQPAQSYQSLAFAAAASLQQGGCQQQSGYLGTSSPSYSNLSPRQQSPEYLNQSFSGSPDYQHYTQQQQQIENERIEAWNKYYEQQRLHQVQQEQQSAQDMERIKLQQKEETDRLAIELQRERDEFDRKKREFQEEKERETRQTETLKQSERLKITKLLEEEMQRQMKEAQREREMAKKHEEELMQRVQAEQQQHQRMIYEQQAALKQQQEAIQRRLQEEEQNRAIMEQKKAEDLRLKEEQLLRKRQEVEAIAKKMEEEQKRKQQEISVEKNLVESRRAEFERQAQDLDRRNQEIAKEKSALEETRRQNERMIEKKAKEFEERKRAEEQRLKDQQDSVKREQELLNIQQKELQIKTQDATDSLQPMRELIFKQQQPAAPSAPPKPRPLPTPPPTAAPATLQVQPAGRPKIPPRPKSMSPQQADAIVDGYRVGSVVKIQRCFRRYVLRKRLRQIVHLKLHSNDPETEKAKQRYRAVNEVYTTEVSYLHSLLLLRDYYMIPMEVESHVTSLFKQEDVAITFSNLKSLAELSTDFLKQIETRLKTFPIQVGDVFTKFAPVFKLYVEYVNNFDKVTPHLNSMLENPQQAQFFETQKKKSRSNADIFSLLIMPVQRIPRYELLLREILKHTAEDHKEHSTISSAYNSLKSINTFINDSKKNVDNRSRLISLNHEIKNLPNGLLIASHRSFVREGACAVSSTKKHESGNYYLFCFNDILVVAKTSGFFSSAKYEYLYTIQLTDADIKDIEAKGMFDCSFVHDWLIG
ncbi:hypothetical protein SAMD00019534_066270 [Acytostelium subglobosum LB1]|uniref:hypothetical protein n=1 Tax=Acytostelium subglobosum LB1 TaxID=1410327 RepID=UPI000644B69B|nr:hypothetical protein SAMD00019534_066270 [Acytostelium subglobosum LB1]GAM23452.1 hypothetical protein SAMD00019534_066270 [Acytostelium subglobosum LB1]|eukprot:XP_012753901.1 hypothetical protein SAMD00019534_066270 [Acytostelium subglobosum LB1]